MATAIKRRQAPEQGGMFRVLVGEHLGDGPAGCECDACLASGGKNHRYAAKRYNLKTGAPLDPGGYDNDLIESKVDLELRFNAGPFSRKFERVHAHQLTQAPATATVTATVTATNQAALEEMSLQQLVALAAEEEIDLKGARTKEAVIKAMRGN